MNTYSDSDNKLEIYNYLMDVYIDTIIKLIDTSYSMNILPFKVVMGMNWIKKRLNENRLETLENGITYLLTNKDIILNFDLTKLDELDEDSDDNKSIKSCVNNFKNKKSVNTDFISDSDDMLNLIIEIKNNTKKIHQNDILIIKKYFELLIAILEKIQNIFL